MDFNCVFVVCLAPRSCSVTEWWGGDFPTSFRDCSKPMLCRYFYVLTNPVPPLPTSIWIFSRHPQYPYAPPRIRHPKTEIHCSLCTWFPPLFSGLGSPFYLYSHTLLLASTVRPCNWCIFALDLHFCCVNSMLVIISVCTIRCQIDTLSWHLLNYWRRQNLIIRVFFGIIYGDFQCIYWTQNFIMIRISLGIIGGNI